MALRDTKAQLRPLLIKGLPHAAPMLLAMPGRQMVNPLFSLFLDPEPIVRWRAISAMGLVVAHLADAEMESARVVMRRLLWSLNDESGGIGWGSPEALGEIMARHTKLAHEYGMLMVSFLRPEGNFIEHPLLQRGVLWGMGRLLHARPAFESELVPLLLPFFRSADPDLRGLAAWCAAALRLPLLATELTALAQDTTPLLLYRHETLTTTTVAEMTHEALSALIPP